MKLLGPWPILQFFFGIGVLGFGVFMIVRGIQKKDSTPLIEDRRETWLAYEHLKNIEENSFRMVELLSRLNDSVRQQTDALKGLAAAIWNKREGF